MKKVLVKLAIIGGAVFIAFLGPSPAQATSTTVLSEKNASKTVAVKLGGRVQLTLHSMYWKLTTPAQNSSLTPKGFPIIKAIFPSAAAPAGCRMAGSGCGTQTWVFTATKVGLTHFYASRTTCGEAMRCTGTNGRFTVTVKVLR